jgi:rsbT antagonist protein RsbS
MNNLESFIIYFNKTLLVNVPNDPDDKIMTDLQNYMMNSLKKYNPLGVIINISMVEIIDSFFARLLSETAQIIKIMGSKTIIVGMRPSVAITSTQLGFTLSNIQTALDVDQAFDILKKPSQKTNRR